MEQQANKNYYQLNSGLVTEANEINFPDGYTTDETNYEPLLDGSRRRRKGLALESGGSSAKTTKTFTTTLRCQSYLWVGAGGDPDKNVMVYRQGDNLFFADADDTISNGWSSDSISLEGFETSGATTAKVDDKPVSFAQGRGFLIVTGQYLYPFYVKWDGTNYTATQIGLRIRDFVGVDDGVPIGETPTSLSDDHDYNLKNRGWTADKITSYYSGITSPANTYPAKNMIWHSGYRRVVSGTVETGGGTREWNADKLLAEGFGQTTAPLGSLFIDPHDTTLGYSLAGTGGMHEITSLTCNEAGTFFEFTATTPTDPGLSPTDEFALFGTEINVTYNLGAPFYGTGTVNKTLDDVYEVITSTDTSGVGTGPWEVVFSDSAFLSSVWDFNSVVNYGYIDLGGGITRSGAAHDDGPTACSFFAGRGWYGGFKNSEFADSVFFSQIVDDGVKLGKCYQLNDPTDENFNSVLDTDGGHIVIPGLTGIVEMRAVRNSLIILCKEGVWEIRGSQGAFTPLSVEVRKLSEYGCYSPDSVCNFNNEMIFGGPGGIFLVGPNQYTGLLEVTNISENSIQSKWNSFTKSQKERCQIFYDDAKMRIYFLFPDITNLNSITESLIFDVRFGAWFRYTFNDGTNSNARLLTGFALLDADNPADNKKAKFIYQTAINAVNIADFDQTGFLDWDGTESPLPYMYTGWDNIGDYQRRRHAPIIVVYSKATETGYTDNGTGWDPTNPSSTLMSAFWDWTNDAVTNKIQPYPSESSGWEVYRKTRDFVPASAGDVDGYPVVVTRNKVRGRGRVLQLKFLGATGKDSHILGFSLNYRISRKK